VKLGQIKTSNYTASDGDNLFADTSGGAFTITLPASPSIGNQVKIIDAEGTFGTNNLTVGRNSQKIQGSAADLTVSTNSAGIALVYVNADNGWRLKYND
jgi:YbbR domain-containing protein